MGKRKTFSVEKIIQILKENEAGIPVTHLARQHGVAAGGLCRQHLWLNADLFKLPVGG